MTAKSNEAVPLKGLAPYIGGKRHLAKRLTPMIDAMPHSRYVEPFVGMGGIFFRRRTRPGREVINDLRGDVVNLFRVVQRHPEALIAGIEWALDSRAIYLALKAEDPTLLTDIERAVRFYLIQHMSYGAKGDQAGYGGSRTHGKRLTGQTVTAFLKKAHERLNGVTIEALDAIACIERFDGPDTLFYCDPPYVTHETLYGKGLFCRADFDRLASTLAAIRGRFILSIDSSQTAREIFGRFETEDVQVTYASRATQSRANELIVIGP